eukprot:m51a1_g1759 hypothetical protein (661) ;mRNA; r:264242-266770
MSQLRMSAAFGGVARGASAGDVEQLEVLCDVRTSDVSLVGHDRVGRLAPGDPQPLFFAGLRGREHARFVKFSPDLSFVCVVTSSSVFEVVSVEGSASSLQESRRREEILGAVWTSADNLVVVSKAGVDLYHVAAPCKLRVIKSFSHTVHWFSYNAGVRLLVLGTGDREATVYAFRPQQVARAARVDLEPVPRGCPGHPRVSECHVAVVELYGKAYLVQLSYRGPWGGPLLSLWQLAARVPPRRFPLPPARRLPYDETRFQVLDNVLAVHLLRERATLLVDVRSEQPVVPLPYSNVCDAEEAREDPQMPRKLFAPADVFVGNSGVLDAKSGALWSLSLDLQQIARDWENKDALVQFLQRRTDGKAVILEVIKRMITDRRPLIELGNVMDRLNAVLKASEASTTMPPTKRRSSSIHAVLLRLPAIADAPCECEPTAESRRVASETECEPVESAVIDTCWCVVVTQSDMFHRVFVPLEEGRLVGQKFAAAALTDYIRSLSFSAVKVEPFIYARLVEILVTEQRWFQLQQVLQYYVVSDSVHIACQLLSLEPSYPAAYQMALDMLKRLGENEHIVEVLLAKKQVVATLRFLQGRGGSVHVEPARVLDVAMGLGDPLAFFTAYKFFEQRGELTHEHYKYTQWFRTRIPSEPLRKSPSPPFPHFVR